MLVRMSLDKTSGAATTVRANADKCKNSDPDGGRQLDGDRVKPNGDPTNLVATGIVYQVSITPANFSTFLGSSNTFITTGTPEGESYHDWTPAGEVSADGRTNTVVCTTLTTNQTVSVQYGPGCSQTVTGAVYGLVLSNVTFSLVNRHNMKQDNGNGFYPSPHWTATSSYPVCYTRNVTGTVSATFWGIPTVGQSRSASAVSTSQLLHRDESDRAQFSVAAFSVANANRPQALWYWPAILRHGSLSRNSRERLGGAAHTTWRFCGNWTFRFCCMYLNLRLDASPLSRA
jgi:hypothetical protein